MPKQDEPKRITPVEDLLSNLTDVDSAETTGVSNEQEHPLVKLDALGIEAPPAEVKDADDSIQWADDRLKKLGPLAVRQLERQLMFGTEKIINETARDILNRIGLKEDKTNKAAPPVIVLLPESIANLPWATKKKLKEEVVDADIVEPNNAQK